MFIYSDFIGSVLEVLLQLINSFATKIKFTVLSDKAPCNLVARSPCSGEMYL